MTCPEFTHLLSSRIDGDLTPPQRIRLEAHLQACADCRRNAEQMERAVAWVRGLERVAAPPPAIRHAGLARTRRSAWEALRPLALAASAVLAALLAWEGFDALVTPAPPTRPALTAPITGLAATPDASAADPTPAAPSPRALGPAPLATPVAGLGPQVDVTPPTQPPAPATVAGAPGTAEPAGEAPAYARIHGPQPAAEEERGEGPDDAGSAVSPPAAGGSTGPEGREPRAAATTVWIVRPEAGAPAEATATLPAAGTTRPATPSRTGLAHAPSDATTRPVATEATVSVPVVAWVEANAVRFGDPGEAPPGELDRAGDTGAATERAPGTDLIRLSAETPRPDADPRTGVIPPVAVERPHAALASAPDPDVWRLLPPLSLQVSIGADGRVVSVTPLPWPGPREVAEALARSVRGWTFLPAEIAGAAIAASVEVAIEFDAR